MSSWPRRDWFWGLILFLAVMLETEEAIAQFEEALRLWPDNENAQKHLADAQALLKLNAPGK